MDVDWDADDLDDFADAMEAIAAQVDGAVDAGVEKTARRIEATASINAPKDTGRLAASINAYQESIGVWVTSTNMEYAAAQEYGSGLHGPKGEKYTIEARNAEYLAFPGEDGNIIFRKSVEHPGVEAQPYLRPAVDEHRSQLTEDIADEIRQLIQDVLATR